MQLLHTSTSSISSPSVSSGSHVVYFAVSLPLNEILLFTAVYAFFEQAGNVVPFVAIAEGGVRITVGSGGGAAVLNNNSKKRASITASFFSAETRGDFPAVPNGIDDFNNSSWRCEEDADQGEVHGKQVVESRGFGEERRGGEGEGDGLLMMGRRISFARELEKQLVGIRRFAEAGSS
ncbi:hypothetical protein K440DRAFT_665288 [Wilcoxina mikolae CBS 423.85]|nr:hypothetical protein K440DRAFT_665288 [Wilcoxina mikolae CBS 423.85]